MKRLLIVLGAAGLLVGASSCATEKETDGSVAPVVATELPPAPTTPDTEAPAATEPPVTEPPRAPVGPAGTVADLLALDRPVILTHAGGENTYPHSTPFAFAESIVDGVDVLDFDVRLTADGVVVVHHDSDTERTADQQITVYESTYDEVHALDNAYWFTAECTCDGQPDDAYLYRGVRTGEVEPPAGYTAEDFAITDFGVIIDRYPGWVLNIEIKASDEEGIATADALATLLTEKEALDRSIVTSFDDDVVAHFHEIAPTVTMTPGLQMSTDFVLSGVVPPDWAPIMQVPPVYEGLEVFTPEYVAAAKAAGLLTWVWPNGEGEDVAGYTALLDAGADGVNASDPAAGVEALTTFLGS